jgi:anaerobic selenocysteine-containing dehydrogenase/Fe-S-cluster-containing dehydrogenase component
MAKRQKRYGMLINLDRCIGCYACQVTCKAEYDIPFGLHRCKVQTYSSGTWPEIKKTFLPRLCNHCDNAPCIEACEENALFKNQDGIVLLNSENCTGCGMCHDKCPYDAIEINHITGEAEKCDFCSTRVQNGESPVCVQSCMGKALLFGDINDLKSKISVELKENQLKVLNPELATNPSIFYKCREDIDNTPVRNYEITKGPSTRRVKVKQSSDQSKETKVIYSSDAMCPSECGISVVVENGIAKKIRGNPHSLINNGAFCAKGASGLQLTYSPHRIKTPLKRAGQRGEDKWEEITWKEAADHIAKKLIEIKKGHGAESVFMDCGDVTDREAYYRLFHAFGTPNTYNHGSICDPNRRWGQGMMMGDERPLPDIQRPFLIRDEDGELHLKKDHDIKLLLNIGANPFVATRFNYMSAGIPAAREENNCRYIVVDPAHTNSAAHADLWLPIIPGADASLLAAMLYCIITKDSSSDPGQKYIDHNFIKKYTIGWEGFRDSFLDHTKKIDQSNNLNFFTPEWAEDKTGISAEKIMEISHIFGITKPAAIEIGMHGTAHHTNGDVTSILMTALCLVTGNVDVPGGLVFIDSQKAKKGNRTAGKHFLEKTISKKVDGNDVSGKLSELNKDLYGDYPAACRGVLADLPQKIREGIKLKHGPFKGCSYPAKAFITRAGNPVITAGSTPDWIDALTARDERGEYLLELMVFIDTHITVSGKYADIILPEAGFLERMGVSDVYTVSPEMAVRDRVIEPLHESKTPYGFMIAVSDALIENGDPDVRAEDFAGKYNNEEDFINEILSEAPGFFNIGRPLPYPDLPEGCLIIGTPDNPAAVWGKKVIKKGELLTVDWLRKHHGVAVWPASYHRYKKSNGDPSGIYPKTGSKKFEFRFSYIENINKKFGTELPATFYWNDCKWNPKNSSFRDITKEYPFQLITGRVHYAMTMTGVCPYLAETETECMKPLNNEFQYTLPESKQFPEKYGITDNQKTAFKAGSVSIPVLSVNRTDGERSGIKTGDVITLENPSGKKMKGKVFLTEEIMPGVIKTAFGPGGQNASGLGFINNVSEYTPNINEFFDPDNLTTHTGMPGFGDILVKIIKPLEKT